MILFTINLVNFMGFFLFVFFLFQPFAILSNGVRGVTDG